jgi:predicted metal-binding protein
VFAVNRTAWREFSFIDSAPSNPAYCVIDADPPAVSRNGFQMSDETRDIHTTIWVCVTCRDPSDSIEAPRAGAALAAAAAAAIASDPGICVRRVECLANCSRGLSAALQRRGAWTYVFGGLVASQDGETLASGARLFARSENGLLPWAGRPEALKRGLIARVPPATLEPSLPNEGCD